MGNAFLRELEMEDRAHSPGQSRLPSEVVSERNDDFMDIYPDDYIQFLRSLKQNSCIFREDRDKWTKKVDGNSFNVLLLTYRDGFRTWQTRQTRLSMPLALPHN